MALSHLRPIVRTALALWLPAVLLAQNAPTTVVMGRVVAEDNGAPVANARVTTSVTVVGTPVVLSDQNGQFSLRLPPGLHDLSVSKTGFARRKVALPADGSRVEVRLARGAAISGRLADLLGNPAVGFRVRVETKGADGKRSTIAETETSDRGEYRIGGLGADAYFVSFVPRLGPVLSATRGPNGMVVQAGPGDAGMTGPLFYPATPNIDEARPIVLRAGDERTDVDLPVPSIDNATDLVDQQRVQQSQARLAQQTTPSGLPVPRTAAVRGRVLDHDGRPLIGARVRLISGGAMVSITTTDKDGRYEFRELAAGSVRLAVTKPGYFPNALEYGGRTPNMLAIPLKDGETRDDVEVPLDKWAAIEGRVLDERGDPMADAVVQLLQIKYEAGRRSLVRVDIVDPKTDDRGRFRMYSLPAGRFIVSAVVNDVLTAELPGYARSYFPGTPDASAAEFVSVARGAEIGGIEFALARMQTFRITGKLLDADGRPVNGIPLLLYPRGSGYGEPAGARIQPDGAFEFVNVAPGPYVLHAAFRTVNAADVGLSAGRFTGPDVSFAAVPVSVTAPNIGFAAVPVTVADTDVTDLVVQPAPPSGIAGRILFDTGDRGRLPAAGSIQFGVWPVDPLMAQLNRRTATINGDWTFTMFASAGTGRLQVVNPPAGWALESIRMEGVDVTDRALMFGGAARALRDVEVTLTDRISTMTGTVVDDRSRVLADVPVIAYSADSATWYPASRFFQAATTTATGTFTFKGLPSGTYNVAAVSRLPPEGDDAWQDPAFLDGLAARAVKVAITQGVPASVQPLRVISR